MNQALKEALKAEIRQAGPVLELQEFQPYSPALDPQLDAAAKAAGFHKSGAGQWSLNMYGSKIPGSGMAKAYVVLEKRGLSWNVQDKAGQSVAHGFEGMDFGLFRRLAALFKKQLESVGEQTITQSVTLRDVPGFDTLKAFKWGTRWYLTDQVDPGSDPMQHVIGGYHPTLAAAVLYAERNYPGQYEARHSTREALRLAVKTRVKALLKGQREARAQEQGRIKFVATVSGDWKQKEQICNALNVAYSGSRWSGSKVFFSDRHDLDTVRDYANRLTAKYGGQVSFYLEGTAEARTAEMTLSPAYGRDYKSKAQVMADWNADKDFVIEDFGPNMGRYVNKSQLTGSGQWVQIRYARKMKVLSIKV